MRRVVAGLLVVVGLAGLVGCAGSPGSAGDAAPPAVTPSTTAPATPSASPVRGPRPLPKTAAVDVVGLEIPAIGLRTTKLEHLSLQADAELSAPVDPDLAGWYAGGTVPGATGPAVIAGHVDSKTGPAVFARLPDLKPGDRVVVRLSDRTTATFRVDRLVTVAKDHFPTDEVYGAIPDAQLRLITCGGPYDHTVGAYQDNTVVFATKI